MDHTPLIASAFRRSGAEPEVGEERVKNQLLEDPVLDPVYHGMELTPAAVCHGLCCPGPRAPLHP